MTRMNKDIAIINSLRNYLSREILNDIIKVQDFWNNIDKNISESTAYRKTHDWQNEIHVMNQDIVLKEYKDNKRRFPNLLDKNIIKINEEKV